MEYDTNESLRHLSLLSIVYRTAHDDTSNPSPLDEPDKLLLQLSLLPRLLEVVDAADAVEAKAQTLAKAFQPYGLIGISTGRELDRLAKGSDGTFKVVNIPEELKAEP